MRGWNWTDRISGRAGSRLQIRGGEGESCRATMETERRKCRCRMHVQRKSQEVTRGQLCIVMFLGSIFYSLLWYLQCLSPGVFRGTLV